MKAFVFSNEFYNLLKYITKKYISEEIVIDYMISHAYYKEYQYIAQNSKILLEKLEKKSKNIGFIKFFIFSKIPDNKEFLSKACDEVKNSTTLLFNNGINHFFT